MAGLLRTKLRYLSWSLFGLLLVALGLFLHWLPTPPRCIIRSDRLSRVQFLSPDGRSFAAVPLDDDGTRIDRWDTTSGQLIAQASYKTKLSTAAYSKNGTLAAGFFWTADKPQVGEASGQLAIVDLIAGRESVVGRFAHNPRHKPRFSPQAKFVAFEDSEVRAGGGDPSRQTRLSIIDATSAHVIGTFRVPRTSEEYPVYGFTSDDRLLFVFSYVGKTVQFTVWDTRQRQVLRTIPDIRRDWLLAPDGRTALVDFVRSGPGRDHLPVLWDLLDDQVRKLLAARHPGYSVLTYRAAFSSTRERWRRSCPRIATASSFGMSPPASVE